MARATNPRRAKRRATAKPRWFARSIVEAIAQTKSLSIKAAARSDHRFIGIWAVVVDGRVFVRSWTLKPGGWYRTFLEDPLDALLSGRRELRVRAVPARSERIRDAVERAYAAKYNTPGSFKYVRGFRTRGGGTPRWSSDLGERVNLKPTAGHLITRRPALATAPSPTSGQVSSRHRSSKSQ
jgi:hypothetical protein